MTRELERICSDITVFVGGEKAWVAAFGTTAVGCVGDTRGGSGRRSCHPCTRARVLEERGVWCECSSRVALEKVVQINE